MGFFIGNYNDLVDFPPATSTRIYTTFPAAALATAVPISRTIAYYPYFIKKDVVDPELLVEVTAAGALTQNVIVGIYDGANGLPSANKLYDGTISVPIGSTGIFSITTNISLKRGFYILAGLNTNTSALATFRTFSVSGSVTSNFGRDSSDTAIDGNYYYTQTSQTSLPSNIGTITRSATAGQGISVFIKY